MYITSVKLSQAYILMKQLWEYISIKSGQTVDETTKLVYSVPYKFMPKRTYQPNKRKRATTHGFLVRTASKSGRNVIQARRRKGRAKLSV